MKFLKTLKDKDIFNEIKYKDSEVYEDRQTVKLIIKNSKGEIALVTNPVHNFFLLPGGGAKSNDLKKEAKREALEETGYYVNIIKEIGKVEEFRNRKAKRYITTCFIAEIERKGNEDLRTEKEKGIGLNIKWLKQKDVLPILLEQIDRVRNNEVKFYNIAFNIIRDQFFFNLATKNNQII